MNRKFVMTSNVRRFAEAAGQFDKRSVGEKCFVLALGNAGLGKTRCINWWGVQNDALVVRLKQGCTSNFFLTELLHEMGIEPKHGLANMFAQALGSLRENRRKIVVDEIENCLGRGAEVLQTLRDLTDSLEIQVVLGGRDHCKAALRRRPELWTRIVALAEFKPATLDDVSACCEQLSEVPIERDAVAEIHRQSEGFVREVIEAVGRAEKVGKMNKRPVTLQDLRGVELVNGWQMSGATKSTDRARQLDGKAHV